ncbi:MAG: PilZ domain-containing protein [Bdellovibrionaceae bacterium]|nr:PilZ domain-containing protein [Pseudobdellovibrionaceae bacterium]
MKKKPLLFTIVPLILIGVCASFYFQTALVLNTSLTNYSRILSKITTSNWITMVAMIASGITILRSSRWAKLLMPITIGIVFWNNYLVAAYTSNFTKSQIVFAAILFALLFAPLYTKKIQFVLSDTKHQWWRTAFRKKHKVSVVIKRSEGPALHAKSHDVSVSGLFLRFDHEAWTTLPKVGEKVELCLYLDPSHEVQCSAVVVRQVDAKGFSPRGMGLQFAEIPHKQRKTLESFLDRLPEEAVQAS